MEMRTKKSNVKNGNENEGMNERKNGNENEGMNERKNERMNERMRMNE